MATTAKQCAVCSEPGKPCSGCQSIYYCSRVHQKEDWKVHRAVCRTFKDVREQPAPNMTCVILFHVDDTKPEFRWIPLRASWSRSPDADNFFGNEHDRETECRTIAKHPKSGESLPHEIVVRFRAYYSNDGSAPNKTIYSLTDGVADASWQKFAGPFLAHGYVTEDADLYTSVKCPSLEAADLTILREWFTNGFKPKQSKEVQAFMDKLMVGQVNRNEFMMAAKQYEAKKSEQEMEKQKKHQQHNKQH